MQYPQILVYETDGLLAAMLRETAKAKRWALRESKKAETCLRFLRPLCPSVLVLKIGTYAKREAGLPLKLDEEQRRVGNREKEQVQSLELLARVHEQFPDTAIVAVGDAEDVGLVGLAWDFGASYVLAPPQSRQVMPEIVTALMDAAITKGKFENARR
jgi:hypothetical protein